MGAAFFDDLEKRWKSIGTGIIRQVNYTCFYLLFFE